MRCTLGTVLGPSLILLVFGGDNLNTCLLLSFLLLLICEQAAITLSLIFLVILATGGKSIFITSPLGKLRQRAVAVWACISLSFCGFQKVSAAQSLLYDLRALNQQVFLPLVHTNENRAYYYEVLLLTRPSQPN